MGVGLVGLRQVRLVIGFGTEHGNLCFRHLATVAMSLNRFESWCRIYVLGFQALLVRRTGRISASASRDLRSISP